MQNIKKLSNMWVLIAVLIVMTLACIVGESALSPATPTAAPTETKTPQPTKTPKPTRTLKPTATPNLVATEQYDKVFAQVQKYYDEGYLPSLNGEYIEMDDFKEDWAQMDWYRWWWFDDSLDVSTFMMQGHFSWSSALSNPEISGCGFVFSIDVDGGSAYAVFLDQSRILFLDPRGYSVGTTKGTGRVKFSLPAEADFSLIVNEDLKRAYVFVDERFIGEYSFPEGTEISGTVGFSILSGTNRDYGTRCAITDTKLWVIE